MFVKIINCKEKIFIIKALSHEQVISYGEIIHFQNQDISLLIF